MKVKRLESEIIKSFGGRNTKRHKQNSHIIPHLLEQF
jgi:hypothetical protein